MKYKLLIVLISISIITNIGMGIYIIKDNILNKHNETKVTEIESELNNSYSKSYFMMNPIDEYFTEKFSNYKNEIEYRIYQESYLDVWKTEYNNIIRIIQKKCIFKEDINIFDRFNEELEKNFDVIKPALLAVMLDNFDEPESPEKHSQGNGTIYKLDMYKGFLYRNACMLFIDYLQGEYKFPDVNLIENSIKINMQKDE